MNRPILILVVVTAVVAGAAVLATRNREALTAADSAGAGTGVATGPLFPVLEERVNDVASVTVAGPDGSFTVAREGDTWGAADKGGYPVDFGKVRGLVVGIAGFDVIEAKTANPDYHAKLGLQAPDAPDSESKRVTLEDAQGELLADVIVGQARTSQGPGGQPSLYARRADEDQTYEVTGRLYVDTNPSGWLDRKVLELKQDRVASVTITHPDGEVLRISRPSAEQTDFDVEGLPEGRELVWPGVARAIASAAQNLTLEDVGKQDLFDFDSAETTTSEFRTFGGLVVTATTAQADDKSYLKIAARVEERPAPVGPPAPEPGAEGAEGDPGAAAADEGDAAEAGSTGEDAAGEDTEDEPEEDALPTPEELQAEADTINARVSGWTYVIPGWSATNLRKRMDELLKPLEPETPPGQAEIPAFDQDGDEIPPELRQAIQEALEGQQGAGGGAAQPAEPASAEASPPEPTTEEPATGESAPAADEPDSGTPPPAGDADDDGSEAPDDSARMAG